MHLQAVMTGKGALLAGRLLRLKYKCRQLRERYEFSLELVDRKKNLMSTDEDMRIEKLVELDQVVNAIIRTVDAKDEDTNGHSLRVAEYSRRIAEGLGLDESMVEHVYQAALLHDVGKVGVPDTVLKKPGRLTADEFEIIRSHTIKGWKILSSIKSVPYIAEGALYHHERWDGNGYPLGLHGEEIPLTGRIIAVADAYDAMTSKRCYKECQDSKVAAEEIRHGAGTQFDPAIVEVFCRCIVG